MGQSKKSQGAGTRSSSRNSRPDASVCVLKPEPSATPGPRALDPNELLEVLQETPEGRLHVERAMALLGLRQATVENMILRQELDQLRAQLPSADGAGEG